MSSTLDPEKCFTCQQRPPEVCQTCADAAAKEPCETCDRGDAVVCEKCLDEVAANPCQTCEKADAALCESCADEEQELAIKSFCESQELELTLLRRLHRTVREEVPPETMDPLRATYRIHHMMYEIRTVLDELRLRKL